MDTVKTLAGLAGKTIKLADTCGFGDRIALVFEDGTAACFVVDRGYDDDDASVALSREDLGASDMYRLGLIDNATLRQMLDAEQAERDRESREKRLAMYRQLQAEFGKLE